MVIKFANSMCFLLWLSVISRIKGCLFENLTATTEDQFVYSHSDYGFDDYPNNYDKCWLIETPSDYTLKLWAGRSFSLEYSRDCDLADYLRIECGAHGDSGFIGSFCGQPHWMVQLGIYSQATYTRVIFHTDNSTVDDGFRLNYKAVSGSQRDDCEGYESVEFESDEWSKETKKNYKRLMTFTLVVIFGIIFVIIAVIVVIAIASCASCGRSASHAVSSHPDNYVTADQPVRYGHNAVAIWSPV